MYEATMDIEKPFTITEMQKIIQKAKKEHKKISIVGAGLSQGMQFLYQGAILIDMQKINHMHINGKTLLVGAGAKWADIQKYINKEKLSLKVMQGSNIFSVGGSLSTNVHGWDFRSGTIHNTVTKLKIINAQGNIQSITNSDPLFNYILGGFGSFGIIVEAELELTDNLPLMKETKVVAIDDYVAFLEKEVLTDSRVLMHNYCLSIDPNHLLKDGVVTNYTSIDTNSKISMLKEKYTAEKISSLGAWCMRNFPNTRAFLWNMRKKIILKGGIQTRNEIMSPPTKLHFTHQKHTADWLQEFFIPKEEFTEFISYLSDTLHENNVNLLNSTVRYVKRDNKTNLSYAPNQDLISVVIFFSQSLDEKEIKKTNAWATKVIDKVTSKGGSFYLPYGHFASQKQFQTCYTNYHKCEKMKSEVDPDHLFLNGFYNNYFQQ